MCTLISPSTEQKIRRRIGMKRRPFDFKDILRERFKQRIKNDRKALFDKMRKIGSDVHDTVLQYIQSEVECLKKEHASLSRSSDVGYEANGFSDLNDLNNEELLKSIQGELIDEQVYWITKLMEKDEEEISSIMEEYIFCPFCQKGTLSDKEYGIVCSSCDMVLSLPINSKELNSKLQYYINNHSNICTKVPQFYFFNEHEISGVFIVCDDCSTFAKIL